MTTQALRSLRRLEGHTVQAQLDDGSQFRGELVSAHGRKVWFDVGGDDRFIPVGNLADVRQIA